jgi:SAM-dependent methyltransferase
VSGDTEWYRAKAREYGGPVLELGAGMGRITFALAQDGVPVHALEAHSGMLEALRARHAAQPPPLRDRVTIVDGDMRSFDVSQRFALVIAPFRVFLHNLTEEDQLACLQRVRHHLRPDGAFAFNVFHPSLEFMARNAGPFKSVWRAGEVFDRPNGGWIVRSEAIRYDTVRQRVLGLLRYEDYGADGTLTRTAMHKLELAYLYRADLERLLQQAGFSSVRIAGAFDGRPFQTDSDELVIEARVS